MTIDGVRVVVDSGLRRAPVFDAGAGYSRLRTLRVSEASADQRRGRAGRTAPGVCYRLWDAGDDLEESTPPEIWDADLAPLALELAAWGCPGGEGLPWLDAPDPERLEAARALLADLGAVEAGRSGAVTPAGRAMARLGVHPRFAHLVLRARDLGCAELGCVLASLLSERDVLRGGTGGAGADINARLDALAGRDGAPAPTDAAGAQRVLLGAEQMARQLASTPAPPSASSSSASAAAAAASTDGDDEEAGAGAAEEDEGERAWSATEDDDEAAAAADGEELEDGEEAGANSTTTSSSGFTEAWTAQAARKGLAGALVALAYPDRIAQAKGGASSNGGRAAFTLASGRAVRLLDPSDPLSRADYVAVADLTAGRDGRSDAIALGAALTLNAIRTHLKDDIKEADVVFWAAASRQVLARRQQRLGSLVLSEAPLDAGDAAALPVLWRGLRDGGWAALGVPAAAEAWRRRAAWLRAAEVAAAGASDLPDLSEEALLASLPEWLGPFAAGARSRAQLQKLDWLAIFKGLLTWDQQRRVDDDAPSHVVLPTGTRVPIEYGGPPAPPTAPPRPRSRRRARACKRCSASRRRRCSAAPPPRCRCCSSCCRRRRGRCRSRRIWRASGSAPTQRCARRCGRATRSTCGRRILQRRPRRG